jgi:hypothetical protein
MSDNSTNIDGKIDFLKADTKLFKRWTPEK